MFFLFLVLLHSVQAVHGQSTVGSETLVICAETVILDARDKAGINPGNGTWGSDDPQVSITPDPATHRLATADNIQANETTIWYTSPNNNRYYFYITRINPPLFYLTGPETYCDGDVEIELTLSGSDTRFDYILYHGNTQLVQTPGTGGALTWTVDETGTYTVEAEMTGAGTSCSIMMPGEVIAEISPLPGRFQLEATVETSPGETEFCSGTSASLRLSGSEPGVSYQLYRGTEPAGTARGGTGNPITWTVPEEGMYHVGATSSAGCQQLMDGTVTVTELPAPMKFPLTPASASLCHQGGGSAQLYLSDSEAGVLYQLTRNGSPAAGGDITGTGGQLSWNVNNGGTYSVFATGVNGCTAYMSNTSSVTRILNFNLSVSASYYCQGTGGVTISLDGSQLGVSYRLLRDGIHIGTREGTGNQLAWENIMHGNYMVEARKDGIGCSMGQLSIEEISFDSSVLEEANPICRGESVQLNASGGEFYFWEPSESLSNNTISNPVATPDETTTYQVTVTDDKGCSVTEEVTVTVYNLPVADAGTDRTICMDESVQLNASGGLTYEWSPESGLSNKNIHDPYAYPSQTTEYTVRVTNAQGCSATDKVRITVNPLPSVNAGSDISICEGGEATLTVSGDADSYLWSTGINSPSIIVTPFTTTSYTVTGTISGTGCSSSDEVTVSVNPLPGDFAVTGGGEFCADLPGIAIGLSGSEADIIYELFRNGNSTGQTVPGNGNSISFGIQGLEGIYTVKARNNSTLCQSIMPGDAEVTRILLPAPAQSISGPSTVCPETPVTYTVPEIARADSYVWNLPGETVILGEDNANTITLRFPQIAGTVNISVRGENQCGSGPVSPEKEITVRPLPGDANPVTGMSSICEGMLNVTFSTAVTDHATDYRWEVPPGAVISGYVNNETEKRIIVDFPEGSSSGYVRVTPENLCGAGLPAELYVEVSALPNLNVNPPPGELDCSGSTIILSATSSTPDISWEWNAIDGGRIVGGSSTANPEVDLPGKYRVTVTDINMCSARGDVTVTRNTATPENITISKSAVKITCSQPEMTLTASTTSIFPISYQWQASGGGNIVSGAGTSAPVINRGGYYTVTATNDETSCNSDPVTVYIEEDSSLPNLNNLEILLSGQITCISDQVQLTTDPGLPGSFAGFHWESDNGLISDPGAPSPAVYTAGVYRLVVTGTNGCVNQKEIEVTENKTMPHVWAAEPASINCADTEVVIHGGSGTPGATYQWSGEGIVSGGTNEPAVVNRAGNYTITVTHPVSGCISTGTVTVNEDVTAPVISFPDNPGIITCNEPSVQIEATTTASNPSYQWFNPSNQLISGEITQSLNVTLPGSYRLRVTDQSNNCHTDKDITIESDQDEPGAWIDTPATITCSNLQITLNGSSAYSEVTFNWTTSDGSIISGSNTSNPLIGNGGTYTLTVTNTETGCTSHAQVTVPEDKAAPSIEYFTNNPESLSCKNTQVRLSGNAANASLLWTGPAGATISNPYEPYTWVDLQGTYRLTATSGDNGCTATREVEVTMREDLPEDVTILPFGELSCTNTSIQLTGTSSTPDVVFRWEAGAGGIILSDPRHETITAGAEGIYTLYAAHPLSGCEVSAEAQVENNQAVSVITFPAALPRIITCSNMNSGVELNAEIEPEGSVLLWEGPGSIENSTTASPTVFHPGTYTLNAWHPETGCHTSRQIEVESNMSVPEIISFNDPASVTCLNPETSITPELSDGSFSYLWETGSAGAVIKGSATDKTVIVTSGGTYILTVTDNVSGCSTSGSVNVQEDRAAPEVFVNTDPDDITCKNGGLSELYGTSTTPGVTYSWSGPGNIAGPHTERPLADMPGVYTLTVTDPSNGCTASATVTLGENRTAPSVPQILPVPVLTCDRSWTELEVSPYIEGVDYKWTTTNGGAILHDETSLATVSEPGSYIITVTDRINGCTSSNTVAVNRNDATSHVEITGGPYLLDCSTGSIQLTGSSAEGTDPFWTTVGGYISSPRDQMNITASAPGEYILTVLNPVTGCPSSATVTVGYTEDVPEILVDNYPGKITCGSSEVTLEGRPADTGYDFEWTTVNGNIVSGHDSYNPVVNMPGTYVITVTNPVTGCSNHAEVIVDEDKSVAGFTISNPGEITCLVDEVQLNATITSGDNDVSYTWTTGAEGTIRPGDENLHNPVVTSAGTYILTVTKNTNQCNATKQVTVTGNFSKPHVSVNTSPDLLTCDRTEVILEGNSDTPDASYLWTSDDGHPVINATTRYPRTGNPGWYTLTVTHPASGCTDYRKTEVARDTDPPDIHIEPVDQMLTCNVTSVKLEGSSTTANVSYTWFGPGGIEKGSGRTVNTGDPGTYMLRVTRNATGCSSTAWITVSEDREVPAPPVASEAWSCFGSAPATLEATGEDIRWYSHSNLMPENLLVENDTYTPTETEPGNHYFYVTRTGSNGCESSATQVKYIIRELPTPPSVTGKEVCEGGPNSQLRAIGENILWYGDPGGPVLATGNYYTPVPSEPGIYPYYATQTDGSGCESEPAEVLFRIRPKPAAPVVTETPLLTCKAELNPAFTATGNNLRWYGDPAATQSLYSGSEFTAAEVIPGTHLYYVSQTSEYGCESDRSEAELVITDIPEKFSITGGGSYCENSTGPGISLSGSEAGTEYTLWHENSTVKATLTGTGAAIDFGPQPVPGRYTVTAADPSGCTTTMNGEVTVFVDMLPAGAVNISGPQFVCQDSRDIAYEILPVDGATHYHWELPPGAFISSGANSNVIRVDFTVNAESGPIRVRAVNSCGEGPVSADFHVSTGRLPSDAGNIIPTAGNIQVCRGDEHIVFEVPETEHALTYEWQLPAGASIVHGHNTRTIKVSFSPESATGSQVVRVRGVNDCGKGAYSDPHTVWVFAPPSVTAGTDQQLCSDQTSLAGSAVPPGGTAIWETFSGYALFSDRTVADPDISSLAMGENIFAYTITRDACSVTDTVRIFNNMVNVNAGSAKIVCSGEVMLQGNEPPAGTTGLWTITGGSASFSNAASYNTMVTDLSQGDNELKWTITKNGCASSANVIITNHRPLGVNAGTDLTTCNGEAYMSASTPLAGQGEWNLITGQAVFEDINDPQSRVQNLDKGINQVAWVVTNHSCALGDTITITNMEIDVSAGADQVLCEPRTTLDASAPPEGAAGEWSVASGAATFMYRDRHDTRVSGLATGTNELEWTIIKDGCIFSETVTIINNTPSQSNAGPDQEVSVNQTQLEANEPVIGTGFWSVMNGSGNFSDPSLNTAMVTDLAPGLNIFRWTISHEGCTSSSDVTINNGSLEYIFAGEDQVLCSNETMLNASDPPFGFGLWTVTHGSARFEDNERPGTRVYDLGPGANVLRWSVSIGSTEYWDEVTVVNNMPTRASTGHDRSLCDDSFVLTGNQPLIGTGRWTIEGGSAVIEDNLMHNTPVTNLAQGNNIFRWTITHENCVSSDLLVVSNDIPTTPDAGEDQFTCAGEAELFPNTPTIGTGEWSVISGSGSFEENFVTNLANGENRLQYTIRNNQCTLSDETVITNFKPTVADAGYNMNICDDHVELNANQPNVAIGETGRWTVINGSGAFADPNSATTLVEGLAAGKNVFRWTIDNQGCTSYDEIVVSYDYIEAFAGHDIITCDSEIVLNANNPGSGRGEWTIRGGSGSAQFYSPVSPNTRVNGLDRGNNILRWTITNNRCVAWDEITVRNNSPSDAYAGADQNICTDVLQLSARSPVVGLGSWSVINGSGEFENEYQYNTFVNGIGPGANTYRWTIENEGCISIDEVVIRNNTPLNTYAGADQVLCEDSAMLNANLPELGTGVWSIVKGAGVFENAYDNITSVSGLAPDENILRWTVSNGHCIEWSEVHIINNKPTTASAGADRVICNDHATLEGNIPLQGTGRWSVISGSGTFEDENGFNSVVTGLSRGNNILRWTISKANCISTSDVSIRNDMPSYPNAGADISVCEDSAPLNGNVPATGTGRWSLVSGSGTFADAERNNTIISGLGQGTNILRWTISHNNCSLSDQVEVRNNLTDVYAGPDQFVYEDFAHLSGNTPLRGSGLWSVDAGGGDIPDPGSPETRVENLQEGVNTFIWSVNIDGCISSDDVRITYYRKPTASFSVSQSVGCPPLSVRFTNTTTGNYPFRWDLGEDGTLTLEDNPLHTYNTPGNYIARLFITGADGQEVLSERVITVHEPPVANFEMAPTELFIPGNQLRTYNYSYNASDYLWDFGDGNTSDEHSPFYSYSDAGSYNVSLRVWSAEGCSDSMTSDIPVNVTQTTRVRFPSAFTPNEAGSSGGRYDRNDFTNHVFYPVIINGIIDNYRLEIFNRWGVKLYESTDIEIGWDGYYRGQLVAEDVYVFRVTGILNNGQKFTETGDFLLMRRD